MGNFLRNVLSQFMADKCYNEFFVKFNFFDDTLKTIYEVSCPQEAFECLKHTISKALGTGIIAGSTCVKFPQILKLVNGKSAVGISFLGVLLELIAVTSAFAYNYAKGYPFSSWGESVFIMIETAIIAFLVLLYNKKTGQANVFAAVYSLITYMLYSGIVPMNVLWNMQIANVPIVVCGKMIQAVKNFQNGHTGQLSGITVNLLFLGGLARIFTSIQETGDPMIIFTFIMASLANGVLATQVLYYRKETERVLLEAKKKKKAN